MAPGRADPVGAGRARAVPAVTGRLALTAAVPRPAGRGRGRRRDARASVFAAVERRRETVHPRIGARPTGARPSGARPSGARPTGARLLIGVRETRASPTGARPTGACPADHRIAARSIARHWGRLKPGGAPSSVADRCRPGAGDQRPTLPLDPPAGSRPGPEHGRRASGWPRTRSSSPADDRSRRCSRPAGPPFACSSFRSAAKRSNGSCSMPPRCGYRSSKSKAAH